MLQKPIRITIMAVFFALFGVALVLLFFVQGGSDELDIVPYGYYRDALLLEKKLHNEKHDSSCTLYWNFMDLNFHVEKVLRNALNDN